MNARPNVPDWQHAENLKRMAHLRASGFKIECSSQGYRVEYLGKFVHAAGTLRRPHGRYREANLRDNIQAAVIVADRHVAKANH